MVKKILTFTKMAGAGNDFIVINARKGLDYKKLAPKICGRTDGVGADGLLILDQSKTSDYRMRIINADGSEAEMCGNGARCLAAYITRHRKPKTKFFSLETLSGTILAQAKDETAIVRLSDPKGYRPAVAITINGRTIHVPYIDTGVPHTVIFVNGLEKINVRTIGRSIRYHKAFAPRGTNVNFVEQKRDDLVEVRTYERGVEDETKACGTGSVATAIISYLKLHPDVHHTPRAQMNVLTQSGEILRVTFKVADGRISDVWLKGSAKFIAEGTYFLK